MLLCQRCGVVFFPRPIENAADYQAYYPYLNDFDGARFSWELSQRRSGYKAQLKEIRRLKHDADRLLDIGAGPGYFCKTALDEGWTAAGVETAFAAVEAGQREFGVSYVALEEVPDASQHAITCHHVLEHIEEPKPFLKTLADKLEPGGILVVHVPHREPLSFLVRNLVGRARGENDRRCQLYYPEHITGFDEDSLVRALRPHGFECIGVRCVSMWSAFYDPFFLCNYFVGVDGRRLARLEAFSLIRRVMRGAVENIGNFVRRGDWVVGHFRASGQ